MQSNRPKKQYGQNFLTDEHVLREIIRLSAIDKDSSVIEIGPGRGALTKHLVKAVKKVLAYEIDETLRSYLMPLQADNPNLEVIFQDVMTVDLNQSIKAHFNDEHVACIANIPYYITSPIIFMLLETEKVRNASLMIQKEVADRLTASPKSKTYGSFTVLVQFEAEVKKIINVKRGCFYPIPAVDSAVIELKKHNIYKDICHNHELFRQIVKASFAQKRKTLLNNLSVSFNLDKQTLLTKLKAIDASYTEFTRAEEMSINDFIKLANGWNLWLEKMPMQKSI